MLVIKGVEVSNREDVEHALLCCCLPEALDFLHILLLAATGKVELSDPHPPPHGDDFTWHSGWAVRRLLEEVMDRQLAFSVVSAGLILLDTYDLIEHGSNMMGSWLTPDGEKVLAILEAS